MKFRHCEHGIRREPLGVFAWMTDKHLFRVGPRPLGRLRLEVGLEIVECRP